MAYASKLGRARISPSNPQAAAVCDRCGIVYNHSDLQQQTQYAGAGLITFNILVCSRCLDVPQPQLKSIAIPADPLPVINPRIQNYNDAEIDYRYTSAPATIDPITGIPIPQGQQRATQDGSSLTQLPIGRPEGLTQAAIMPLVDDVIYGTPLAVLSVISGGADQITVTCSAPHNLSTGSQISVQGLSKNNANGFFSVVVTTATAFTYQTYSTTIPAGSLLQSSTRIVTAKVGVPRGFTTIVNVS